MALTTHSLTESVVAVCALTPDPEAVQSLSDEALLSASTTIAAARCELDAHAGWVAAEIARRSRFELGYAGLAQRQGFRTPEALIQRVTGATRGEATTLVRVGTMVADAADADALATSDPTSFPEATVDSWRSGIARAVSQGALSFAQADAIRTGLGDATDSVTGDALAEAAEVLVQAAVDPDLPLHADELRRLARQLRDSMDADGLRDREQAQRDSQYIKAWRRGDGMVAGSLLLDAENGAYFLSVVDELTSPRRGGPRFVDATEKAAAKRLVDDPRTTDRIAADGIMQLLRIGVAADPNTIYGSRKPAVRIVVTQATLDGAPDSDHRGVIEDTGESMSVQSIERRLCDEGSIRITVDAQGAPLDLGREQRLFSAKQKVALAVRDGGCLMPDCDRPPSWTEAHHIDHYVEHHGLTNIDDGVLLCRHHHLLMHNNGWRIIRDGSDYFVRPPMTEDPEQVPRRLFTKNPLSRERLLRERARPGRNRPGRNRMSEEGGQLSQIGGEGATGPPDHRRTG